MTNNVGTLFVGMTNDLVLRIRQHKEKLVEGFARRNSITRLVYYEATNDIVAAISRERQLKRWSNREKIALVEFANPQWSDLSSEWYEAIQS
jgi:putative endonuclease